MNSPIINKLKSFKNSVFFPLLMAFLIINIAARQNGGPNERSRFATLRAMSNQATFAIDDYKHWTIDWSQAPNGQYYSNKPPGAMFVGFPVFVILDQFARFDKKQKWGGEDNKLMLAEVSSTPRVLMSLLYQIIPFIILCYLFAGFFRKQKISKESLFWGLLAILFANTTSVFMNVFFGHALTAVLLMALQYFLWKKRIFWVGLMFGLALLNDYSVALFLPIIVFYVRRELVDFIKGGIIPGILWCWYHIASFGSPFKIPNMYQNPIFQDAGAQGEGLLSIFHTNLPLGILAELLFGLERGLLITQPWIFVTLFTGLSLMFKKDFSLEEKYKQLFIFSFLGLLLLLIMNSFFGGWHGGSSSGPRYLSIIIPLIGLSSISLFKHMGKNAQRLFKACVFYSLLVRGFIYITTPLADSGSPLFKVLSYELVHNQTNFGFKRILIFILTLVLGFYFTQKRMKQNTH